MKFFAFLACLILLSLRCHANEEGVLWILVSRPPGSKIVYNIENRKFATIDEVVSYILKKSKQHSKYPAVRSIFESTCTLNDVSTLSGWLRKLGVLDKKYYRTDVNHRTMAEFEFIGGSLAFPAEAFTPK